ncbi:glutamine-hydrolyzing GMP synthase, partial [Bacteroidota bacterium]
MIHSGIIIIIDFGSQYTQLIARRIREFNVYSEIYPHTIDIPKIKNINPQGIVLSGGPMSVNEKDSPDVDEKIFNLGIPVLGICYGMQLICSKLHGNVESAKNREYGKAELKVLLNSDLFQEVNKNSVVWMSHGDIITNPPEDFKITSETDSSPISSISDTSKNIFGLQFHPEVAHTQEGKKILSNFVFNVCKCSANWTPQNFIMSSITDTRNEVGSSKVICALSGGVDSSVAAVLISKSIGDNLTCIHIDTGLMRKNESELVIKMFKENYELNLKHVDASGRFLTKLKGVSDPEKKREIIGNTFIEIFEEESILIGNADYLVQGTLYPDVIESIPVKGESVTIKTHHNVGGLPKKMKLKLIEPFRELFKDEVRVIGKELGLSEEFTSRHPFPGPGFAVRILDEVTEERLDLLREADDIFINEIRNA